MKLRVALVALLLCAFAAATRDGRCAVRCSCALGGIEKSLPTSAAVFWGVVARVIPGTETRPDRAHFTVLRSWKGADGHTASTASRITSRDLRAVARSEIANIALGRADTLVSRAALREALDALDPQINYTTIAMKALPAMIELGDGAAAITWARSKTGISGAYARLAVIHALGPCAGSWWEC